MRLRLIKKIVCFLMVSLIITPDILSGVEVLASSSNVTEIIESTESGTSNPTSQEQFNNITTSSVITGKDADGNVVDPIALSDIGKLLYNKGNLTKENMDTLTSRTLMVSGKDFQVPTDGIEDFDKIGNTYIITYKDYKKAVEEYNKYSVDKNIYVCEFDSTIGVQATKPILGTPVGQSYQGGGSIKVVVLDSGANGYTNGYNVFNESTDVTDVNGHGTYICNTIVENTNSDVDVIPVKIAGDTGYGSISSVIKGLEYALSINANIINMSFITTDDAQSKVLKEYITQARFNGISIVVSAGNQGNDVKHYVPAGLDLPIVVGSCTSDGERKPFSNYGTTVDFNIVSDSTSEAAALATSIMATALTDVKSPYYALENSKIVYKVSWKDTGDEEYLPKDEKGNIIWSYDTYSNDPLIVEDIELYEGYEDFLEYPIQLYANVYGATFKGVYGQNWMRVQKHPITGYCFFKPSGGVWWVSVTTGVSGGWGWYDSTELVTAIEVPEPPAPPEYSFNVSTDGGISSYGQDPAGDLFQEGTWVGITAYAKTGYDFDYIRDADTGSTYDVNPSSWYVDRDRNVEIYSKIKQYNITIKNYVCTTPGGTFKKISDSNVTKTLNSTSSQTTNYGDYFTTPISAPAGYKFHSASSMGFTVDGGTLEVSVYYIPSDYYLQTLYYRTYIESTGISKLSETEEIYAKVGAIIAPKNFWYSGSKFIFRRAYLPDNSDGLSYYNSYVVSKDFTLNMEYGVPDPYTIIYEGNGATSGSVPSQDNTFGYNVLLNKNSYNKDVTVNFNTNGSSSVVSSITKTSDFLGWVDRDPVFSFSKTSNLNLKPYRFDYIKNSTRQGYSGNDKEALFNRDVFYIKEKSNPDYALMYDISDDKFHFRLLDRNDPRFQFAFVDRGNGEWYYVINVGGMVSLNADGDEPGDLLSAFGLELNYWDMWCVSSAYSGAFWTSKMKPGTNTECYLISEWNSFALDSAIDPTIAWTADGSDVQKFLIEKASSTIINNSDFTGFVTDLCGSPPADIYSYEKTLTASWNNKSIILPNVTRLGYSLSGWYTLSVGGTRVGFSGDSYTPSVSTTLYAQWTKDELTINYTSVKAGVTFTSKNLHYGDLAGSSPVHPDMQYGTFSKWVYWNGTKYIDLTPSTICVSDIDAKPSFDRYESTLTFNSMGGSAVGDKTIIWGDSFSIVEKIASVPTKGAISFLGWYTAPNGTGEKVFDSEGKPVDCSYFNYTDYYAYGDDIWWIGETDFTLYAFWNDIVYTVTFNGNGGSSPVPASVGLPTNGQITTFPTTSRTGYTLSGWNRLANGTGATVTSSTLISSNMTIYAQWANINYSIFFNSNGGSSVSPVSVTYDKNTNSTLSVVPSKPGYMFNGWYSDVALTNKVYGSDSKAVNSVGYWFFDGTNYLWRCVGNITLHAKWLRKPVIDAKDVYLAGDGVILNAQLIENVIAADDVDGDITNKVVVTNFASIVTELANRNSNSKTLTIEYSVENSVGAIGTSTAILHYEYTDIYTRDVYSYRYISKDTIDTLGSTSIWREFDYMNVLRIALGL